MDYILIVIVVSLIAFAGVCIKRKLNIQEQEIRLIKLILEVVDYISKELDFKHDKISLITKYTLESLLFVEEFETTYDIEMKKQLVIDKAIEICAENKIEVTSETYVIVEKIADFLIEKHK